MNDWEQEADAVLWGIVRESLRRGSADGLAERLFRATLELADQERLTRALCDELMTSRKRAGRLSEPMREPEGGELSQSAILRDVLKTCRADPEIADRLKDFLLKHLA